MLYVADRMTRRMLPLAALLSLTLAFPDEAPSRFKIAMRSGGTVELQRRLEQYRRIGANEPALAAQRLLELVADLSRHDRLTRGHSERVRAYSQMIGEELGLTEAEIDRLRWAALLHDIGKLEIPFEILNKPDRLTADEFETIMRHPGIGARLTAPLAGWLGESVRAVGEHHERWDGDGYPNGLRGTDISLAARIVAVADAFDVMTSFRSYKKPGTAAEARANSPDAPGPNSTPTSYRVSEHLARQAAPGDGSAVVADPAGVLPHGPRRCHGRSAGIDGCSRDDRSGSGHGGRAARRHSPRLDAIGGSEGR